MKKEKKTTPEKVARKMMTGVTKNSKDIFKQVEKKKKK